MTNQERMKILEWLAEGSLTVEQADQLLERLGAQSKAAAEQQPDQRQEASGFTMFSGEQLAALQGYEVDADYVRALQSAGLSTAGHKNVPSLTKKAICGTLGSGGAADAWTQAADANCPNRSRHPALATTGTGAHQSARPGGPCPNRSVGS